MKKAGQTFRLLAHRLFRGEITAGEMRDTLRYVRARQLSLLKGDGDERHEGEEAEKAGIRGQFATRP